jgi:hypothetical protein
MATGNTSAEEWESEKVRTLILAENPNAIIRRTVTGTR